jgi:8-oxo-dGTP pyrophosphatase MutT (NUDIX family)
MTPHDLVQWSLLPDRAVQVALRIGYRVMRRWWRLFPPDHRGACVLVRHAGEVLVVRHSYLPGYGLPSGRVMPGERPVEAARRELAEECAVAAPASALRYLGEMYRTHMFEYRPPERPEVRIDNREIVAAGFVSPREALAVSRWLRPFLELAR